MSELSLVLCSLKGVMILSRAGAYCPRGRKGTTGGETETACSDECSALLSDTLCVPLFWEPSFDVEEMPMLNNGHKNGLSGCKRAEPFLIFGARTFLVSGGGGGGV